MDNREDRASRLGERVGASTATLQQSDREDVSTGAGRLVEGLASGAHEPLLAVDDLDLLVEWLVELVEHSVEGAALRLAAIYERRTEYALAERTYLAALTLGQAGAGNDYGAFLLDRGRLEDADVALRAAAEEGDVLALHNLGKVARERGSLPEAVEWHREAAAAGVAHANLFLAQAYKDLNLSSEAEQALRAAVAANVAGARNDLAMLLQETGGGTLEEIVSLYETESLNGEAEAPYNLGLTFLELGEHEKAQRWLQRAAALGDSDALEALREL